MKNEGKSIKQSFIELANAIIKQAIKDEDRYFFNSSFGENLLHLAGADGNKEKFLKAIDEKEKIRLSKESEYKCSNCGKIFIVRGRQSRDYCSNYCRILLSQKRNKK